MVVRNKQKFNSLQFIIGAIGLLLIWKFPGIYCSMCEAVGNIYGSIFLKAVTSIAS